MRSDYALYIVAVIFFIITAMVFIINLAEFQRNLSAITTIVLGLLFAVLGYFQRPKPKARALMVTETPTLAPPTPPAQPATTLPTTTEVVTEQKAEIIVETAQQKVGLTEVKGIGEKRAEQLKSLGVNTVEELANASAKDLAKKLKISPKITDKWIDNAKKLVEKS